MQHCGQPYLIGVLTQVGRIDVVVQQLDKKIQTSADAVGARITEENSMLDEQLGRHMARVDGVLTDTSHKLEVLAVRTQNSTAARVYGLFPYNHR